MTWSHRNVVLFNFIRNKQTLSKLEVANHYVLKTLLNTGNDLDYNSILFVAGMNSLKFRRCEQSVMWRRLYPYSTLLLQPILP